MISSVRGTASGLIRNPSKRDPLGLDMVPEKEGYSLGDQKQKVLNKFFELSTTREPNL